MLWSLWFHILFMLTAFIICFPAAIACARWKWTPDRWLDSQFGHSYLRQQLFRRDPLTWHITFSAIGAGCCFLGNTILFLALDTHMNYVHSYIGTLLCFIIIFSQPGSGATIYDGIYEFLRSWHRRFGYILYVLAWINIGMGLWIIWS